MEIKLQIENSPSKEKEKKVLFKLWDTYRRLAPDSYLVNLFSLEFINWVGIQIDNDFTCDAYEYIKENMDSAKMKADLEEAMSKVSGLEQSLLALKADYDDREGEATEFKNRWEAVAEINSSLRKKNRAVDHTIDELRKIFHEREEKEKDLESRIMELKAELYDFMKKGDK